MIWCCYKLGLAYNLKTFPTNEIAKGRYAMQLKKLESEAAKIAWPSEECDLPVFDWDEYQQLCKTSGRSLVVIAGFIHDVTTFMHEHPGGLPLIKAKLGKDATTSFFGGVVSCPANTALAEGALTFPIFVILGSMSTVAPVITCLQCYVLARLRAATSWQQARLTCRTIPTTSQTDACSGRKPSRNFLTKRSSVSKKSRDPCRLN